MYVNCGAQTRTRYVSVSSEMGTVGEKLCKFLIGMHAFTGCDKVSASTIMELGMPEWVLSDTLFESLQ